MLFNSTQIAAPLNPAFRPEPETKLGYAGLVPQPGAPASTGRVITTGLIEALGEKGFQDIADMEVTGHRVMAVRFPAGRGALMGGRVAAASPLAPEPELNVILPQMRGFANDARPCISFNTVGSEYPMAISATYGKGTFIALAIPDDFTDRYRLPESVPESNPESSRP